MRERAAPFAEVLVDFGTGDGAFAYRTARAEPGTLVIGVDAAVEGMREVSHTASRKPARGGLPNVVFGRMSLEDAPGVVEGIAQRVTVLFPWGSLLRAVARPDPIALAKLARIIAAGGALRVVFGYGAEAEAGPIAELGLPALGSEAALERLESEYAAAGLRVRARHLRTEEVAIIPTTWAKKIAFSGRARTFVLVETVVPGCASNRT